MYCNIPACRKFGRCQHCQGMLKSSPPLILPCGHKICRENCQHLMTNEPNIRKCPECSVQVEENTLEYEEEDLEK